MTTTSPPQPAEAAANEASEDRFRYGWRYVRHTSRERYGETEIVPLTPYDVLHPQEGDFIVQNDEHSIICTYLYHVLKMHLASGPAAFVSFDLRIAWDVPELEPHGPDIAVVFGVENWDSRKGTFDVAEQGVRPALLIEVTSPSTRRFDLNEKVEEYELAGVPFYVVVDVYDRRRTTVRRVLAYESTLDGYRAVNPDEQGRIWMKPVGLWIGFVGDRLRCFDADGNEIPDVVGLNQARLKAEQAAVKADSKAQAEAKARAEAEARAQA
ncbi:MAG: Uma2 family endonuclease, partial [Chloroflexaceae bacterium]|nr:Uma2 family endonuclease [Chloroflexaceae bacterium]